MRGWYSPFQSDYVSEFNELVDQWKSETALLSTTRDMMLTPSFSKIVGMQEQAIPLIIESLRRETSFLFLALHVITKQNPVPPSAQGRIGEIINAWLTWASRNSHYAD